MTDSGRLGNASAKIDPASAPDHVVVIGSSLGGLQALGTILGNLPSDLPAAVAIAQHRHPDSEPRLVELLSRDSTLPIREPDDKEPLLRGYVYLAPADYHLLIEVGSLALSLDPPTSHARPSADVLMESAAVAYGSAVIAVILTGSSADGAEGAAAVHRRGGQVVVEDPLTAYSNVAPLAALASTGSELVVPLDGMAQRITKLCYHRRSR